jgi:hypothetical protein
MIVSKSNNKVVKSSMGNFVNVLSSAYEDYPESYCHDFIGICLTQLQEGHENFINESMEAMTNPEYDFFNESVNEALNVTDPKIVKEKKGTGISVMVNGHEYRYVSPTISTEKLFKSFTGMLAHGNAGFKALNWLKKNSLCYYGSKNDSEEGKSYVGASNEDLITENEYKGYKIQQSDGDIFIRDGKGDIVGKVETDDAAKEFIDDLTDKNESVNKDFEGFFVEYTAYTYDETHDVEDNYIAHAFVKASTPKEAEIKAEKWLDKNIYQKRTDVTDITNVHVDKTKGDNGKSTLSKLSNKSNYDIIV